jgi:hypothetical protein
MTAVVLSWCGSFVVILALAVGVGRLVTGRFGGLLIDGPERYSLTHFQVGVWSLVVLSLIGGTAMGRWCSEPFRVTAVDVK